MFKPISTFEEVAEINEVGDIRTLKSGKPRKTFKDKRGEVCITLKGKRCRVKSLLALTFMDNYEPDKDQIIFKDGNPDNVKVNNILIIPRYKLNDELADQMRDKRKQGYKLRELVEQFGVSKTTVIKVLNGTTWKD
ncbi:hypothetical protein OGA32_000105 [Salmonella enterica]|nr:hypothetical protein [Salmonella enterica]